MDLKSIFKWILLTVSLTMMTLSMIIAGINEEIAILLNNGNNQIKVNTFP